MLSPRVQMRKVTLRAEDACPGHSSEVGEQGWTPSLTPGLHRVLDPWGWCHLHLRCPEDTRPAAEPVPELIAPLSHMHSIESSKIKGSETRRNK